MSGAAFTFDDRELMRKLDKLPAIVEGRVARRAVNAGTGPLAKAIKQATPIGPTGNLRRSIGRKSKLYRNTMTAVGLVGPRVKLPPTKNAPRTMKGYHGHIIENGWIMRDGRFHPGNAFLERGQEKARAQAMDAMNRKLVGDVEKEWAKL